MISIEEAFTELQNNRPVLVTLLTGSTHPVKRIAKAFAFVDEVYVMYHHDRWYHEIVAPSENFVFSKGCEA